MDSRDWQTVDLCTSLYRIQVHMKERDGVWDDSWVQVDNSGWLQEIAAHAFGCQIFFVGW